MSFNYEDLSMGEIKDLLRQWRDNNERRSEDVMELWAAIMDDVDKLGNEKYLILEQVLFAALDTHATGAARRCAARLRRAFPGSLRVLRYRAALLEAEERYGEALELLEAVLKADETNVAARKRHVAILRAQGLLADAIKELVDYLKKFVSDVEAWQQLCALYLQAGEPARAAFCAEECLLHQPHSHLLLQRLADIRYTMGGVENLELAKTYYSQAAKLNPRNMRALLGLFLASNSLLGHYKSAGGGKRQEALKLCQFAQKQVALRHQEARAGAGAGAGGAGEAGAGAGAAPPLARMLQTLAIAD